MSTKAKVIGVVAIVFLLLGIIASFVRNPLTVTVVETVEVVKEVAGETVTVVETVEVEKVVEVPGETVVETVEVVKEVEVTVEVPGDTVTVIETVEVEKMVTATPTPPPPPTTTPAWADSAQKLILQEITLVQDNGEGEAYRYTCAGNGALGVLAFVKSMAPAMHDEQMIFVVPNAGSLTLWGETSGFRIWGNGAVELVPRSSNPFTDPSDGSLHWSFPLKDTNFTDALDLATSGSLQWIGGSHGDAGYNGPCDPQYAGQRPPTQ